MAIKHTLCEIARPFILCLPFARIRVLALLGGRDQYDPSWQSLRDPRRVFFDRGIRAYIAVDLREWGGRWHYFSGRYYDQANRLLAQKLLREGDTYIDVGANHGLQSLAASHAVGATGLVIAIEPNPTTFALLKAHLAINRSTNVHAFNVGLSDAPGSLKLANATNHPGTFTFRPIDGAVESYEVPVVVGDELIAKLPVKGRVLVKIDTEGHEAHVMRGFQKLMESPNVGFVVEITDEWLKQTGSSATALYDDMHHRGFESYGLATTYPWFRPAVRITRQPTPAEGQHDVFFARPDYFKL